MSTNGKGSSRRPCLIPKETFESNWENIFKKKEEKDLPTNDSSESKREEDLKKADSSRGKP